MKVIGRIFYRMGKVRGFTTCGKLLVLVLFLVSTGNVCAQTYYYECIAIVENGHKQSASGDGHFITFTSKGCYDSDKSGISEDFGFREYQFTSDGIKNYYGDSYFGKAYYYFNTDLSRLNLKVESTGKVYVYSRKTAPAGVTHSSRTKVVPPAPIVTPPSSGGSSNGGSDNSSSSKKHGYAVCHTCGGTMICKRCGGKRGEYKDVGYYTGEYRPKWFDCVACNGRGKCSDCHGTGKIRY